MWPIEAVHWFWVISFISIQSSRGEKYKRIDISTARDRLLNVDDEYGGTIYVGDKKSKYPKDLNSTILVRAHKLPTSQEYLDFKTFVGFNFVRFDIPDKWPWSGTCGDYVEIYEATLETTALTNNEYNTGLCSDLYTRKSGNYDFFTENSDTALVRFISDIAVEGTGFELAFTSFYKSSGSSCHSEAGEFFCANSNCIAQILRCDKLDNCGDNSDEKNCVYEDAALDFFKEAWELIVDNYALVIAIVSFSSMIFSVILAFCVRVICQDESRRLRQRQKKKQNIIVGADGKKIINPNLKAPVYRKNPGL